MMTVILKSSCRASDLVVRVAGHLAAMLMPVLAGVVAFEVFSRYVLNAPTIWGYDTALFLFGYIAALGGAYAQQKRAHINVDVFYLSVSAPTRRIFSVLTNLLGMVFLYVMLTLAFDKYNEAVEFDYRTQSEWAAPIWHFWVMIMIAASLFLLQLVRDSISQLYSLVLGKPLLLSDEEGDSGDLDTSGSGAAVDNTSARQS
ncbi:TRAP transporter small permease subunit [Marinobacterium stanieri]|uniref:TRAP transporter small permease subunit n=1 Tax=Marinobacterium stanieri TaxID=49186 RepID=UPI0002558B73|nr:TRAP transporter small permease [Marinobacterium stanieri]